jgi:hypothetical protein
MKKLLNRKGEGTYIDSVVFILVAVIFIAFILNLFSIISAKQQLDVCADQLTRQIQLSGEVNSTTDSLFQSLCGDLNAVENISYTVDTTYHSGNKIQLGTPFRVTVTATAYLGGFGDFGLFPIELTASGAGISEEYWK